MQCHFYPREDGHNIHDSFRKKGGRGPRPTGTAFLWPWWRPCPTEVDLWLSKAALSVGTATFSGHCYPKCDQTRNHKPLKPETVGIYGSRNWDFACVGAL